MHRAVLIVSYCVSYYSTTFLNICQNGITESLPKHWKDELHNSLNWGGGANAFIKHVTDIEISSKESKLVSLRSPPQKGLSFECLFPCDDHNPRVWCDISQIIPAIHACPPFLIIGYRLDSPSCDTCNCSNTDSKSKILPDESPIRMYYKLIIQLSTSKSTILWQKG